jgi:hypothetical protein
VSVLDDVLRWYGERPARRVALTGAVAALTVGMGAGLLASSDRAAGGAVTPLARQPTTSATTTTMAAAEPVATDTVALPSESPTVMDHEQERAEPSPDAASADETTRRAHAFVVAWLDATGGHEAWMQRLCGPVPLAAADLCAGFAATDVTALPRITPAADVPVEILAVDGVSETVTVRASPDLTVVITSLRSTADRWVVTSVEPVAP